MAEHYIHIASAHLRDGVQEGLTKDGKCPRCGDDLVCGFGLAGGGFGAYESCEREGCNFFCKELAPDDR